jgi:cohesin loading factor subunit SCC2
MARGEFVVEHYMQIYGVCATSMLNDNVSDRLFPPQVSSLDDIKTSNQAENNAAKTIALDHLGVIAARIQSNILKFKQSGVDGNRPIDSASLKPLDDVSCTARSLEQTLFIPKKIFAAINPKELDKLLAVHQDIASHLCKRSSEDQAYDVS